MNKGICRLCNEYGDLTYEHVPPKVAFNKRTRFRSLNFLEYVTQANPLENIVKGKIEQGGVGYYSLCSRCNNFLGATYVSAYQQYTNSFIEFAKMRDLNYFQLTLYELTALKIIKQIASMFLSLNDEEFSNNNRDLAEFILNPQSNDLPKRFRLFTYLNTEGELRYLPLMSSLLLQTNNHVLGSELAFPPLGHVLTIDFEGDLPCHQEITSFKIYKFDELISYDFNFFRLPTYFPFFLDYRDKLTIQESINNSK